jgi:hypothetical protein
VETVCPTNTTLNHNRLSIPQFLSNAHASVIGLLARLAVKVPNKVAELAITVCIAYNVPSPPSYINLRTYNGIMHPAFQSACNARGLLETEDE